MKTFSKAILATMATSMLAVSAHAMVSYGAPSVGQPYVGVKASQINTDLAGAPKSMAYGVYAGYNFNQNFGAEVELQRSEKKNYRVGDVDYEYSAKTYGAYGTYRYHFANTPMYFKAKAGVAQTKLDDKSKLDNYTYNKKSTSLAGGVGLGFAPSQNFAIEAGYNQLDADVGTLTIGAHLGF